MFGSIKNKSTKLKVKLFKKPFIKYSNDYLDGRKGSHPHVVVGKTKDNKYVSVSSTFSNVVKGEETTKMKKNLIDGYMVSSKFYVRDKSLYHDPKHPEDYSLCRKDYKNMLKIVKRKHFK